MTHPTRRITLGLLGTLLAMALPLAAAQTFPSKTVTLVVPFPPGGGPDLAARVLAEKLAPKLGQPVVVDNRPGAGALLGASAVARSAADGHTLLFTPNTVVISPHVLAPGAGGGVDVHKDLVPVIAPATTPMVLVANPQLGATTLKGLVELARKSPGVPYGSPGNGSPMHFAGEMLKRSAQVDLMHVPYRGVGPSITAALSGEVKLLFTGLGGAVPHIKAGKLIPLALTEKARSPLLPDVPTATEQGVAGVEVNAWYGVLAPAGTPAPVIARLNKEFNDALKLPDVRERLAGAGLDVLGGTPQVLADFMKADNERYGKLAKELNIKAD
ncbi:MAG: tripartite tricarboxylate transporter substrate binding protein [Hydrogenophaga sp.]|jgi:tripartite-type tricarboxylate transporter receptor subunit TctC|uniref:Bug family tripartite tricarboxylate transporter substrate binding protein n=1 Tax=Hydrogenophaga sp. TaxID=1904254 RepID=UPI001DA3103A|nr:tripartite tricarboxylate transporter substrate binding protein [Hydrogenophaga sp.]MBW0171329.1 tripartite tricarboxylate transporter substrate binding protein [Hydrogenophaga sp.]MBW0186221.1 tripartite tricarboxylate transporter substrate binding protein [Hydrogenophaga sp.]